MHIIAGDYELSVSGQTQPFTATLTLLPASAERELVLFRLEAEHPAVPSPLTIRWTQPAVDIQGVWDTDAGRRNRYIGSSVSSKSTSHAPVVSLFNMNGANRLTFALSDAMNPAKIVCWIDEYTAEYNCSIELFTESGPPVSTYEVYLLLDARELPFQRCLADVVAWWGDIPAYTPSEAPEIAKLPMYSTWYSFHQQVSAEEVERQCQLAKELGCQAVIMDDGWQTNEPKIGYSTCGDWEVAENKIPDMRAHVERVHRLGMKYLLWYAVPFVGKNSNAWSRFEKKLLCFHDQLNTGILDPRFPEVREFLIGTYEQALVNWDLDGFKLDFVDYFVLPSSQEDELGNGRDYDSIPMAVDRLLTEVMTRLRSVKPNVMIEFRQTYVGPLMRKYGNMFRVADCPNDIVMNRLGTVDLRLLSGKTTVHADMLMWNPNESPETAALQFIHSMFGVPQISVLLDRIPDGHRRMIGHWLAFWISHKDVLLEGALTADRPDLLYPTVMASNSNKLVAAVYADYVLKLPESLPSEGWIVNGTCNHSLYLKFQFLSTWTRYEIVDCEGNAIRSELWPPVAGIQMFEVPPSGMIHFTRG